LRAAPAVGGAARLPALDGLRAIAVAAVVAYHLDQGALPGGYLGVDVFFVLSGYLITTLLLAEWDDTRSIALVRFWRRRARRLLPPLLLTLVGVAVITPSRFGDVAGRVRGELFAALAQGSNWFEAVAGRSYFDTIGRPSPLQHLWSLGVEAQFYAVWPLLAFVALYVGGPRAVGRVAAVGVGLSFAAMAIMVHPGTDPSRVYYGTDTRAGTLLVGATLAVFLHGRRPKARRVDAAGVLALLALGLLALRLDGASIVAYRGGLLAAALLTAIVLAALLVPDGRLARAVASPPLVFVGTRSYAIYLWHWPVITATRPGLDTGLHGPVLLALRLVLTLALAEGTTRLVGVALTTARHAGRIGARRLVLASTALVLVTAGVAVNEPSASPAFYVSPTTSLAPVTSITAATATTAVPVPPTDPAPTAPPATAAPAVLPPPPSDLPAVPPDMPPASGDVHAVAVGESVLMAAGGEVQRAIGPGTVVDADVARQPDDVLRRLAARRAAGYLDHASLVVIQMGTNGAIDMRRMERMAELVQGVPRIVAVTVHVDRPWAAQSNQALRDGAARWPWLHLAEWDAAVSEHPEWLGPDGVHPNREGARHYADLVHQAATAP
jgi:peptidoglycan/LPS O-acetylase OafA/YrhL/lysophospholipase L1-like esterase